MTSLDNTQRTAKHGSSGHLIAQDGDSVPVSITHHGEDLLLVVLDRAGEFLARPLDVMTLESAGARGIVRTAGRAEVIEANLLRFTLDETAEVVQRREFVRVTAAKRIVLEDEEGDVIADALTVDISGGGLLVQLPRSKDLPTDTSIYFSLYLGLTDYDDQVNGTVRVVRRKPDNQFALSFEHISRANQERLIRFVFERQRVALRVTRGDTT
jgi:PilZ domain